MSMFFLLTPTKINIKRHSHYLEDLILGFHHVHVGTKLKSFIENLNANIRADSVTQWSNGVILNSDKCKKLRIALARDQPDFQLIFLGVKNLKKW